MALFRNRFRGHCASGDIFVFTMWCRSTSPLATVHTAAGDFINTLWGGATAGVGYHDLTTPDVGVDNFSTAEVNPATGRQTFQEETDVSLVGDGTGNAMPADVAIVVSERTIIANRSGRGRFYLPQPHVGVVNATGLLSDVTTAQVADAAQAAFQAVTATATPVVYSTVLRDSTDITRIDVGNLADTQRRRENALQVTRTRRTL